LLEQQSAFLVDRRICLGMGRVVLICVAGVCSLIPNALASLADLLPPGHLVDGDTPV